MKNQARRERHSQAGSIFFWIFFMVFLFAALSLALTQGFRGGSGSLDREKSKIVAQEIVQYLNVVKAQFDTLRIGGCSPLEISFDSELYVRYNGDPVNDPPPSSPENCAMFDAPSGVNAISFQEYGSSDYSGAATSPLPGSLNVRYANGDNVGTAEHDLTAVFTGMDLNACVAVLNLVAQNGEVFTEVPFDTWTYGGTNSYTQGTSGTLNALTLPTQSKVWALRQASSPDYCQIGMIIKVN